MSKSARNNGTFNAKNHPFVSATPALYVVCVRDAHPCYLWLPLREWNAALHSNDIVLIGIYPSFLAAKAVADELNLLWSWDGSDKAWIGECGVWIGSHEDVCGGAS